MRIAKRIGILIFLGSCFFLIDRSHISLAHGCPERDQCRDQAFANYNATITGLNQEWSMCEQFATDFRNSCLDSAHQDYFFCIWDAQLEYNYMIGRCEQVTNHHERQACFDQAWVIYQQVENACQIVFDSTNNACWQLYYDESQGCTDDFIYGANQAQVQLSEDLDYCDTLCP